MKHVTIIATSLNEQSMSQLIARLLETELIEGGTSCEFVDLREVDLPMTGSTASWESVDAAALAGKIEKSSHVIFAVPIYCYDVNAAAKNVIELIGRSFTKKVVSFACSAGGANSYMSVMGMANHLMLDFRSIIVPRFLYVDPTGWNEDKLTEDMTERLKQLIEDMAEIQVNL